MESKQISQYWLFNDGCHNVKRDLHILPLLQYNNSYVAVITEVRERKM